MSDIIESENSKFHSTRAGVTEVANSVTFRQGCFTNLVSKVTVYIEVEGLDGETIEDGMRMEFIKGQTFTTNYENVNRAVLGFITAFIPDATGQLHERARNTSLALNPLPIED